MIRGNSPARIVHCSNAHMDYKTEVVCVLCKLKEEGKKVGLGCKCNVQVIL
jgi:hypothetical protein